MFILILLDRISKGSVCCHFFEDFGFHRKLNQI